MDDSELYIVVEWPDIQDLMDYNGFHDNCFLADCDKFGSSAYFCNVQWLKNYELL